MTATATDMQVKQVMAEGSRPTLRLAYLTTKYPAVSHTFIRRELLEIERRGHHVLRVAIRPGDAAPVDPADIREHERTHHILSQPKARLFTALLSLAVRRPAKCLRAFSLALALARRSDRGLIRHLAYFVEAAYLVGLLRREGVQHVHVHFGTNAAAVAMLARRMGGPTYSLTVHGPDEFDAVHGLSIPDKIRDAAFVAAITSFCASQLKRWAAAEDWPKIHIVRCTVGPEFLGAGRPIDPTSKTLVCVGRLTAQKGHLVLIEAFAELIRGGHDASLVLAGDGELRPQVEAAIRRLGLESRVRITGWIDERRVREEILAARAVALASFAEGLPVVLMEALALGRPVVATSIAGIPELVRPGRSGWLVTPGSAEELACALREVLHTPAERLDAMAAYGRQLVAEAHATPTEAARLEALFLRAVKAPANDRDERRT